MGRTKSRHFNQVASVDAVAAYDPTEGECCDPADADGFRVDIGGYPKSPWNLSCARVFAKSFLREHPEYKKQAGIKCTVEEAWTTHFDSLRRAYKRQRQTAKQRRHDHQQKRRGERKNQASLSNYISILSD